MAFRDEADLGYIATPLTGIWASAPYLHHGSVPTMWHLLVPCARPATFYRGNLDYDPRNMGFVWDRETPETIVYDTSHRGQSNMGHVGAHYLGDLTGRPSPNSSRTCPPI